MDIEEIKKQIMDGITNATIIEAKNAKYDDDKIRIWQHHWAMLDINIDHALEAYVVPSVCDSCGEERKCKLYPIGHGNAVLCYSCFVKEENFLRMNYRSRETTNWSKLQWYNLGTVWNSSS